MTDDGEPEAERPEWIKCVMSPVLCFIGVMSWCGKNYRHHEWLFTNLAHAEGAVSQGSRLVPCPECLERARKAMEAERPVCPECGGAGVVDFFSRKKPCEVCNGTGVSDEQRDD